MPGLYQQSDPVAVNTKGPAPVMTMTPGGLLTHQSPQYSNTVPNPGAFNANMAAGSASRPPSSAIGNVNATAHQSNFGPVDTGLSAFQQFSDSAYDQAWRQMQPQMDAQQRRAEQSLVSRGLQPGSAAYNAEMDRITRGQNDMLNQAAYGAQQQGMAAQNQYFNQAMQNNQFGLAQNNQNYQHGFGYDQLANQRGIAGLNAAASTANANTNARASMYGQDQANYRALLGNQLDYARLNEQGRQFNSSDAFRNQQLDSQTMLGLGNMFNNFNSQNTQNFLAQQAANQNWHGNVGGVVGMAPGSQFTPVGGTAGNMLGLGQARANASAGMWGSLGGGIGGLAQGIGQAGGWNEYWSDARAKENIKHVGTSNGVKLYEFNYKGLTTRYRGPMAQDLQKTHPEAVIDKDGLLVVDFDKLPVNLEVIH